MGKLISGSMQPNFIIQAASKFEYKSPEAIVDYIKKQQIKMIIIEPNFNRPGEPGKLTVACMPRWGEISSNLIKSNTQ
jgi:hypothetical protein